MKKRSLVGLVVAALASLVAVLWVARWPAPADPGVLDASGRIEGDQAAVGARVGGKIVRLAVREGDRLERGALIAELASEQIRAQLQQAEHVVHTGQEQLAEARARVASAQRHAEAAAIAVTLAERESQARIGEAEAAVGAARARLREAKATLENVAKDYARYRELFARGLIAAQQRDQARAADEVGRATMEAAQKQVIQAEAVLELARASRVLVEARRSEAETAAGRVSEARAAVETARAQIQAAEAGRLVARANLGDTRVLAPFGGTVLRKLVEAGEVVAAGTPLITLVDLSRLHAKVYVAEAVLGKIKGGDPARAYTDAFPQRFFEAVVAEVSQQAEFTPRDVHMRDERVKLVFAVKLAIRNPEGILKPGMPVDTRIRWNPAARWADGRE